jgi:RHS repeat-associated protein
VNSTTLTANADGSFQSEVRYSAYGEVRHADGTTVTDKLYTGQQQEVEIGLSYYIARFYDPVIAHLIQPDSIVPEAGSTVGYDRYAYVYNNPINLNDPTGNRACDDYYNSACRTVLKQSGVEKLPGSINYNGLLAASVMGKDYTVYNGTNCTSAASNAVNKGGIPTTQAWYDSENSLAWIKPQQNFDYWTNVMRFNYIVSADLPPVYNSRDKDARERINDSKDLHALINENAKNIQIGDLVYYKDPSDYSENGIAVWTHVAMIVDIEKDAVGNTIPYVMEVDGPTAGYFNQTIVLPRSMFDTRNNHIQQVAIVFIGR